MLTYLEMARNPAHGGGDWGFTKCIWSPTRKRDGRTWSFWEKVREIKRGDTVLHLRGVAPSAEFLGYSVASEDGGETTERPPIAGEWSGASSFYRAMLGGFQAFEPSISLTDILARRRIQLEQYFDDNHAKPAAERSRIFFVRQSGKLQCLNGAYLSEIDAALFNALFGESLSQNGAIASSSKMVRVATQLREIEIRIGQAEFAKEIKAAYSNQCCFPGCNIADPRFLIGAHIARWSDKPEWRGDTRNGLCLCVLHDRAFELGLFGLDDEYRVVANVEKDSRRSRVIDDILAAEGSPIRSGSSRPLRPALQEHRRRHGIAATPIDLRKEGR